jgi:hypothetical protein
LIEDRNGFSNWHLSSGVGPYPSQDNAATIYNHPEGVAVANGFIERAPLLPGASTFVVNRPPIKRDRQQSLESDGHWNDP